MATGAPSSAIRSSPLPFSTGYCITPRRSIFVERVIGSKIGGEPVCCHGRKTRGPSWICHHLLRLTHPTIVASAGDVMSFLRHKQIYRPISAVWQGALV